jgi:hypothetical protein
MGPFARLSAGFSRASLGASLAVDRMLVGLLGVGARRPTRPRGDRGDVPGWVMVTVMTAGLVAAVFAVFRDAIVTAVQTALAQVVSGTGG